MTRKFNHYHGWFYENISDILRKVPSRPQTLQPLGTRYSLLGTLAMRLSELISEDLILPSLKGTDVSSVLQEFSEAVCSTGRFSDPDLLFERLYDREKQESTGIGNGLAIPHCKIENLQQVVVAIGYSIPGVDFRAIDGNPTFFFFLVVSPSSSSVLHLRALAALSRLLRSSSFLSQLRQRPRKEELIALIKQEEEILTT